MQIELDFSPTPDFLEGQRNAPLGWRRCLSELIDNAFDKSATHVNIIYAAHELRVSDDGVGCADPSQFFQQGRRGSKGGLGRYGVGLKDASLWLWGRTKVESQTTKKRIVAAVDWNRIKRRGEFKTLAEITDAPSAATGTTLVFEGIERRLQDKDRLLSELAYTFFPAIAEGKQITFARKGHRKQTIPIFQFPPLEHVIEKEDSINDKPFRVHAGVVQEGHANPKPGFTIAFKHRVITTTADGCGSFGTARFAAMVHLSDRWQLSRNKDELVEDALLLADRLYQICKPALERAAQQSQILDLTELETELSQALQEALKAHKKEMRSQGNHKGTVEPQDSGRTRQRATRTQPGESRLLMKTGKGIRVQFVIGLDLIGKADFNTDGTLISLNLDEPIVDWARKHQDRNALIALAAAIFSIEAAAAPERDRHRLLPEIDDDNTKDRFLRGFALYTKHLATAQSK